MNNKQIKIIEGDANLLISKQIDFYTINKPSYSAVVFANKKDINYVMPIGPHILYVSECEQAPNIEQKSFLYICAIGDRLIINRAKSFAELYIRKNPKSFVRLTIAPTEFGGCGEMDNTILRKDGVFHFLKHYTSLLSSNEMLDRDVILDSNLVFNNMTDLSFLIGISNTIMHGIDSCLAMKKTYSDGLPLTHELIDISNAMLNTIRFNNIKNNISIPILQRLSILHSVIVNETSYSAIHALTYPLVNRGMEYNGALNYVGTAFANKFIDNKYIPKIKTTIKTLNSKLKLVPDRQEPSLFNIHDMYREAVKYANVYLENSGIRLSEKQITELYSDINKEYLHG